MEIRNTLVKNGGMIFIGFLFSIFLFTEPTIADSTRGIKDKSVTIGVIAPLSRLAAHAGKGTVDAFQTYFKYINEEKGGIHGRKLELVIGDNQYEPSRSLAEFKKLVSRDNVMAIISFGTPTTTILVEPAMEEKVPVIALAGAPMLIKPPKRYIITMTEPYEIQATAVVVYIVSKIGDKKPRIGIFYNNDDLGRTAKAGVEAAAQYYGFKILTEAPHIAGSPIDKAAVTKFKAEGVKYVLVGSHSGDVSSLLLEMKSQGLDCDVYGLVSPASDRKIVEQAGDAAARYHSVAGEGQWFDKNPGVARMIEISKKYAPPEVLEAKSLYYGTSWYIANFVVEGLQRSGKGLTVEKFLDALNTFKDWDTGGLAPPITINQKRRVAIINSMIIKADLKTRTLLPISDWIELPEEIVNKFLGQ